MSELADSGTVLADCRSVLAKDKSVSSGSVATRVRIMSTHRARCERKLRKVPLLRLLSPHPRSQDERRSQHQRRLVLFLCSMTGLPMLC